MTSGRARLAIAFGCFVIFSASPVSVLLDSQFALLTTESLLRSGTPALNSFKIDGLDPARLPPRRGLAEPGMFYQLVRVDGRVLYDYPHGGSFLALPFVAVLDSLGVSTVKDHRAYDLVSEVLQEKLIASLLMASVAGVFFQIGMAAGLRVSWSAVVALSAALGSQVWSSASLTMWSQTWEVFLSSFAVLILLRGGKRGVPMVTLATLMGWTYFVRPSAAVAIAAVTAYVWIRHRRQAAAYLLTLLVWAALFFLYSKLVFGQMLPDYYQQANLLSLNHFAQALPAILLSPSRGLLVFVPTSALVLYMAWLYRTRLDRGLMALSLAVIAGNVLLVASFPNWWGGWCYGPRLLTGTVPWFVLLGALGCRFLQDDPGRAAVRRLGIVLVIVAVLINGWGAVSPSPTLWSKEVRINSHPQRVWDWRHPQFLAGL